MFAVELREPTKSAIGPGAEDVKSDAGQVVVHVEKGGGSYRVIIVTDEDETGRVLAEYGPYPSQ